MSPNYAEDQTVFSTVMDYSGYEGVGGVYRSIDGGKFFDGISMLDMRIEEITDLAFSPVTSSQPVLMLVEYNGDTYIFYTDDATAASPQWLLKDNEENFDVWDITMISWDEAGDTVMFMAKQNPWEIYRSTDNGNSFKFWRTVPTGTIGEPKDWVVANYSIVNVIGDDGYWGTRPVGNPITSTAVNSGGVSIDRYVSGSNVTLAVGMESGKYAISTDNGATWKPGAIAGANEVYVAFGPDGKLYAATNDKGNVYLITDKGAAAVKDSYGAAATADGFSGIWVSPDNTLYAIGTSLEGGSMSYPQVANGSLQLKNDGGTISEEDYGTATLNLGIFRAVVAGDYGAITPSDASSYAFTKVSGPDFIVGEVLYVVGDDLVWGGTETVDETIVPMYLRGDVLVVGAESGGYGRISLSVSVDTADAMVAAGLIPYSGGFNDTFPLDGVSASITSSTLILGQDTSLDPVSVGKETMFRLLLGTDESKYNVWETEDIDNAFGLWGTVGSNIAWTVVNSNVIWAFEDFNSGAVQNVTVVETAKNAANATKSLKIDWTALACTNCYKIFITDPAGDVIEKTATYTTAPTAGAALTVTYPGFDYATKYDVRVQACVDGPLQSRLSSVGSTTTECYLLAPVPLVPVNGMQDASIAPSFVWDMPVDGCAPISYDFQLATDAGFNNIVAEKNVTGAMGYTHTARDLDYDTDHYWRVRSVYGSIKSAWTPIQNFHTMLEPKDPIDVTITQPPAVTVSVPPMVTVPPAQTITVSVPPAVTLTQTVTSVPTPTITMPDQPTPAYIWVIVAVGAILTIAVIVLIIRTRRAE